MVFLNAAHTLNGASVAHIALQQSPFNRFQVVVAKILQCRCDNGAHRQEIAPILQRLLSKLLSLARQLLDLENQAAQGWCILMGYNSG